MATAKKKPAKKPIPGSARAVRGAAVKASRAPKKKTAAKQDNYSTLTHVLTIIFTLLSVVFTVMTYAAYN